MSIVYAPWTPEEVSALNRWQASPFVHPFTCGGNRMDAVHQLVRPVGHRDYGQLVPTRDGWVCLGCDYTQNWCHDFMLGGAPRRISDVGDEPDGGD